MDTTIEQSEKVLCVLGDWREFSPKKGRGVGQIFERRPVIYADPYNWVLTHQNRDGSCVLARKFYPCFRLVLQQVQEVLGIDPLFAATKIVSSLSERLGKRKLIGSLDIAELGKLIDDEFKVSFGRHDNVMGRVFRGEVTEEATQKSEIVRKSQKSIPELFAIAEERHKQFCEEMRHRTRNRYWHTNEARQN